MAKKKKASNPLSFDFGANRKSSRGTSSTGRKRPLFSIFTNGKEGHRKGGKGGGSFGS